MFKVDQNYMRRDRNGSFDGRLNMRNHRISGLADPTDADDAVTRRYVASRSQALSDEVQDKKSKLDALQNFLRVDNNQVLIREYELLDAGWIISRARYDEEGRINDVWFVRGTDDSNQLRFIDIFTLKEYFKHLLEKPVDDFTWLRIKQPETYTIHFDLIGSSRYHPIFSPYDADPSYSFSFELHTRGEIIHFSEHNPKHDINLEMGENCLLVWRLVPENIKAGSKIYVCYNI